MNSDPPGTVLGLGQQLAKDAAKLDAANRNTAEVEARADLSGDVAVEASVEHDRGKWSVAAIARWTRRTGAGIAAKLTRRF